MNSRGIVCFCACWVLMCVAASGKPSKEQVKSGRGEGESTKKKTAPGDSGAVQVVVDDVREGELPIDAPTPLQILQHHNLITKSSRLDKKFKGNVIAILPSSAAASNADGTADDQLQNGYDAAVTFGKKLSVVVPDWYRVKRDPETHRMQLIMSPGGYNKTFVRRVQGKGVKVVPFVRFDRASFPSHDDYKSAFQASSTPWITEIVASVQESLEKHSLDGIVLDFPGLQLNDVIIRNSLSKLFKELKKAFKQVSEKEEKPAFHLGLLLRLDHSPHLAHKDFLAFADFITLIILGQRSNPFAEGLYPNPSTAETKQNILRLVPRAGTKQQPKSTQQLIVASFDLLGYQRDYSGAPSRMTAQAFTKLMEVATSKAHEGVGCSATGNASVVEVEWHEERSEFLYKTTPQALSGIDTGSNCLATPAEATHAVAFPSLKSLKLHLELLEGMKQSVALWNFGLGLKYMMELI